MPAASGRRRRAQEVGGGWWASRKFLPHRDALLIDYETASNDRGPSAFLDDLGEAVCSLTVSGNGGKEESDDEDDEIH